MVRHQSSTSPIPQVLIYSKDISLVLPLHQVFIDSITRLFLTVKYTIPAWIKNSYRKTSEHNHIYVQLDSTHNFSFSYIKRGFVEFQINGNFRHNHIAIYDFTET